jgi:hypothetical protein
MLTYAIAAALFGAEVTTGVPASEVRTTFGSRGTSPRS